MTLHVVDRGDGCWIGINAVVMEGAKRGRGARVDGQARGSENAEFQKKGIIEGGKEKGVEKREKYAENVEKAR